MNCRRVSNLLSAYIDAELTGFEMLDIRAHLDQCAPCRQEHQSLQETKRLLGSLALKTPRLELDALLHAEAQRAAQQHPLSRRWVPAWLTAAGRDSRSLLPLLPRPRPLAATAALSLAGLCLATAPLRDAPGGGASDDHLTAVLQTPDGMPQAQQAGYPAYTDHRWFVQPASLPLSDPTPLTWSSSAATPVGSGGGILTAANYQFPQR